MIYAYARCSTNESKQDINRQVRELKEAGAERCFIEYEHGDAAHKEQLETLLDLCKEGDQILTTEISRLARSIKQLLAIIDVVKEKKLCLRVIGSITIDCTKGEMDCFTEAFIMISGVFAELELNIIRQRVRSGMKNAREKGAAIGRPRLTKDSIPDVFYKHYPLFLKKQLNITELARVCKKSRNTIYKYIELVSN